MSVIQTSKHNFIDFRKFHYFHGFYKNAFFYISSCNSDLATAGYKKGSGSGSSELNSEAHRVKTGVWSVVLWMTVMVVAGFGYQGF